MEKPQWVLDLEAKHGLPIEQIPGTIYALCYDPPTVVHAVSRDYAADPPDRDARGLVSASPIRHYVGWSQQTKPERRIGRHHDARTPVTVTIVGQGTMVEEDRIKHKGKKGERSRTGLIRARAAAAMAPAHQYQSPSVTAATIKPAASTTSVLASPSRHHRGNPELML